MALPPNLLDGPAQTTIDALREIAGTPAILLHLSVGADSQTLLSGTLDTANSAPDASTHLRPADERARRALWPVASYTKSFVTVVWARVIAGRIPAPLAVRWETSVSVLFSRLQKSRLATAARRLYKPLHGNPLMRDLLMHREALVEMNERLLAPDGTWIMNEEEFFDVAPRFSAHFHAFWGCGYEYSNANYIFASILLEMLLEAPLHEIMDKHLFRPLGMNNTFVGRELRPEEQGRLVRGFHLNAAKEPRRARTPCFPDAFHAGAFGAFSCIDDLAKFNHWQLDVFMDGSDRIISQGDLDWAAKSILDSGGHKATMLGHWFYLNHEMEVPPSLNHHFVPSVGLQNKTLWWIQRSDDFFPEILRTTGVLDGYSTTVYALRPETFVIVLGNSSGPLDVADYLAHYVVQETYDFRPRMDPASVKAKFTAAADAMKRLEHRHNLTHMESGDFARLAGRYIDGYGQRMEILPEGGVYIGGADHRSEQFQLIRLPPDADGNERVRIMSVPARRFGIESITVWRDLDFVVADSEAGTVSLTRVSVRGRNTYLREDAEDWELTCISPRVKKKQCLGH